MSVLTTRTKIKWLSNKKTHEKVFMTDNKHVNLFNKFQCLFFVKLDLTTLSRFSIRKYAWLKIYMHIVEKWPKTLVFTLQDF